jgi:hypothetical protein
MKLTKRKGFNFFRSYWDVYNELPDDDKLKFMEALLNRQFLGEKPTDLKGMAKFAYISQTNSIDTQVKGYEDKTGIKLNNTPTVGVNETCFNPTPQVEVEEKGKEKGEVEEQDVKENLILKEFPLGFDSLFLEWEVWKDYKKKNHKFKYFSELSEARGIRSLLKLSNGDERASIDIIQQSIDNGWKGFVELKQNKNINNDTNKPKSRLDRFIGS